MAARTTCPDYVCQGLQNKRRFQNTLLKLFILIISYISFLYNLKGFFNLDKGAGGNICLSSNNLNKDSNSICSSSNMVWFLHTCYNILRRLKYLQKKPRHKQVENQKMDRQKSLKWTEQNSSRIIFIHFYSYEKFLQSKFSLDTNSQT